MNEEENTTGIPIAKDAPNTNSARLKSKPSIWIMIGSVNFDEDEFDEEDGDQEIGVRKPHSHSKKSQTSIDMEDNVRRIIGDDDEEDHH